MQHGAMHAGSVYLTEAIQTATRALTVSCIMEDNNETRADHLTVKTLQSLPRLSCELYLSKKNDTAATRVRVKVCNIGNAFDFYTLRVTEVL